MCCLYTELELAELYIRLAAVDLHVKLVPSIDTGAGVVAFQTAGVEPVSSELQKTRRLTFTY